MGNTDLAVEGLFEGIQKTHRYIQGEFWTVIAKIIDKYGKTEFFDARNEFAVQMCQRISKVIFP
jgi:hypothetical protein